MANADDTAFIQRVNRALAENRTYAQIAEAEGVAVTTLFYRVRSLGYKTAKRLVPVHAPAVDTDAAA